MAKKGQESAAPTVSQSSGNCRATDCRRKPDRAGFCAGHFQWFKMGLITKNGDHAKDFEKKFGQNAQWAKEVLA